MKNIKRFLALGLAAVMTFSMVACGGGAADPAASGNEATNGGAVATGGTAHYDAEGTRVIRMACWWDRYYDSGDTVLDDDPAFVYNDDGSVNIPEVLRPYMGGMEKLLPKR